MGLLVILNGCQSNTVGMTRTASGDYVTVQQDSLLGMKMGKPHYDDNGKRVDVDDTVRIPGGSMKSNY
jgi:hypothetical protein